MARHALTFAALVLAVAGLAAAQDPAVKRKAQYLGGFHPDACRYPPEQRRQHVSACCIMDLDIAADGHVIASDGVCTDPAFLPATQRCLSAQRFMPATINGLPVRERQTMEYEWRAEGPAPASLCKPLRTS